VKRIRRTAKFEITPGLERRFWSKVTKTDSCWLWTGGCKNRAGYGWIGSGGRGKQSVLAHRVSWVIAYGTIPDGLIVCHKCDTPSCVRPDHLFLGDDDANQKDSREKNRASPPPRPPIGECNPRRLLTDAQEDELIELRKQGASTVSLSQRFGVSKSTVLNVINVPRGVARG